MPSPVPRRAAPLTVLFLLALANAAPAQKDPPDRPAIADEIAPSAQTTPLVEVVPPAVVSLSAIETSVLKIGLAEGVTPGMAIDSMLAKAVELNMRLVGHQDIGTELRARGLEAPRLEIFQFCNPDDAIELVRFDPRHAAYMPCRIALVEDGDGRFWLITLWLDMLIDSGELPPRLQVIAIAINAQILSIIAAGATGTF